MPVFRNGDMRKREEKQEQHHEEEKEQPYSQVTGSLPSRDSEINI